MANGFRIEKLNGRYAVVELFGRGGFLVVAVLDTWDGACRCYDRLAGGGAPAR